MDEDEVSPHQAICETLAGLRPDANLLGFAVVLEWSDESGSRWVSTYRPPNVMPWELMGWLKYIEVMEAQPNLIYAEEEDEDE